jgi:septum site-determining protein MinC
MTEQTTANVTIKGIKNGILVELNPTEAWLDVTGELARQIDDRSSFFTGSNITVDLGTRPVPRHELTSLKALLERRGLAIWSIMSESETTIDAAHALDLKTNVANTVPQPKKAVAAPDSLQIPDEEHGVGGTLVKRTLRSGQFVRSDSHVVIVGDVNPGAKIVAGGDIVVWGRLRGVVHAGAEGDEHALVCALDMSPTQLRIAGYIVTSPDDSKRPQPLPEVASIRDGQIVVEAWR